MKTEVEELRSQVAVLQEQHIVFARQVKSDAHAIAAKCLAGLTDKAGVAALELCTLAAGEMHGIQMQREQAGNYDLGTLVVNAHIASNSETGWERED